MVQRSNLFVGVDIGRERLHVAAVNGRGELVLSVPGPCTNLARALQLLDPAVPAKHRLWIAGGAIASGNVTEHAEFNAFADPEALQICLSTGWESVVLVPLEVLGAPRLVPSVVDRIRSTATPLGAALDLLERESPRGEGTDREPIWDVVAAALMAGEDLARTQQAGVISMSTDPPDRGVVHFRPGAGTHRLVTFVDPVAVVRRFEAVVSRPRTAGTAFDADCSQELTIIIPVCDDPLIYRCLESIDVPCPTIISTNGSPKPFLDALVTYAESVPQLIVLSTPERGLGLAYDRAIARAVTPLILLMDSDCVFESGTITAMLAASTHGLVKGRVRFDTAGRGTRLVAAARRLTEDPLVTGKVNAYSPPLLYRTSIVEAMGGYHFNTAMKWREDRDFELRRRASRLPVHLVPNAVIRHKPLSVAEDLRSVRSYGAGQAHGEQLNVLPRMSLRRELRKASTVAWRGLRRGEPGAGSYAALRNLVILASRGIAVRRRAAR